MRNYPGILIIAGILLVCFFLNSCGITAEQAGQADQLILSDQELGLQTGDLVEVSASQPIPVQGYGIVAGLAGTGSTQCPPEIRQSLKQYILRQIPKKQRLDVDEFIRRQDTAVVRILGVIPAVASRGEYFDVRVEALEGTETTSLAGGRLYTTDLAMVVRYGLIERTSSSLAVAAGPIFIDNIDGKAVDLRRGYVLAGGKVLDDYGLTLTLREPDYRMAGIIRNRLNERFGEATAEAVSPAVIRLNVPPEYKHRKKQFVTMVKSVHLGKSPELTQKRIRNFIRELAASNDKDRFESALEAIGKQSLAKLPILLNSSNEEVRLRSARCMLRLGSNDGLKTLRQIAFDPNSAWRLAAIEAIGTAARRNDAIGQLNRLLADKDFSIRFAAYEQLCRLDDISITRSLIAGDFYLETVSTGTEKAIYVSRSGRPRIVLFGAPMYCTDNLFIESADGDVILNSPEGAKYVSIIRKHPTGQGPLSRPLKSLLQLADIIRTLSGEPGTKRRPGAGVAYCDTIAILEEMIEKGAVKAEFHPGPKPKIQIIVKKPTTADR